jgi:hypothetical protein
MCGKQEPVNQSARGGGIAGGIVGVMSLVSQLVGAVIGYLIGMSMMNPTMFNVGSVDLAAVRGISFSVMVVSSLFIGVTLILVGAGVGALVAKWAAHQSGVSHPTGK